jgi:hypothetical protein
MNKLTFIVILLLSSFLVYSQQNILVFKKRNKTIASFWKGSTIAFQLANKQWQKGEIMKIQFDSFYIRPFVIQYSMMGTDTIRFNVVGFSIADVYAMPKRGILIDYINGQFQISRSGGHVHFYWIKSGLLFRIGAAGYAGLHVLNGIIEKNLSFSKSKTPLGIAAAVFLGGVLLKKMYTPTLRLKEKYHMEVIKLSNQEPGKY